jgi:hypothetical protein
MPVTKTEDAKQGGFQQVREALEKFEGDCVGVEYGQWGGKLVDDNGKPLPPREYYEILSANNAVLLSTEELSMDISEKFSFRVNCSEYRGSFYIDDFLGSIEKQGLLFPDGLVGKRLVWQKFTHEAKNPMYNSVNFILEKVVGDAKIPSPVPQENSAKVSSSGNTDMNLTDIVLNLAVGKNPTQLRNALNLQPELRASSLFPLIQSGALVKDLVEGGRLTIGADGLYTEVK